MRPPRRHKGCRVCEPARLALADRPITHAAEGGGRWRETPQPHTQARTTVAAGDRLKVRVGHTSGPPTARLLAKPHKRLSPASCYTDRMSPMRPTCQRTLCASRTLSTHTHVDHRQFACTTPSARWAAGPARALLPRIEQSARSLPSARTCAPPRCLPRGPRCSCIAAYFCRRVPPAMPRCYCC